MPTDLDCLNPNRQAICLDSPKEPLLPLWQNTRMPKAPTHDWYLIAWCESLGKKQKDLVDDLDWNPSKASLMFKGQQRYHRDDVNAVAAYLGIEPYELLMHPADANAIKRMRTAARQITAVRLVAEAPEQSEIAVFPDRKAQV